MAPPVGRTLPLSLPRRFISDLLHLARRVPAVTAVRRMPLAEVAAARALAPRRVGWAALFIKGYAVVAGRRPELRRAYVPLPWPHLYEHASNLASVSVERRYGEGHAVFFAHVRTPESRALDELESELTGYKERPLEEVATFRRMLRLARWPRPVRRLLWWYGLDLSGRRRARHLGTFALSVLASHGAATLQLLSPLATSLNYGVLTADGTMDVYLTYDHRVLDGGDAARALADLERVLCGEVLDELRRGQASSAGPVSDASEKRWAQRFSEASPTGAKKVRHPSAHQEH